MINDTTFVICEVGSWHGRSSRAIADNLPEDGVLICCDSWNGSSGEPDAHATAHLREGDDAALAFWRNNQDHLISGKIIQLRMQSANAAAVLRGSGIQADIVWIDADHSYEGCKADILNFRGLVKKGGVLCGHDYYLPEENPLAWIGVRQCVTELFPDVNQAPNTSIWHLRCTCPLDGTEARCDLHGHSVREQAPWEALSRLIPVSGSHEGYGGFFDAD